MSLPAEHDPCPAHLLLLQTLPGFGASDVAVKSDFSPFGRSDAQGPCSG